MIKFPHKVSQLPTKPYFAILMEMVATGGYNEPLDVWDIYTFETEEEWKLEIAKLSKLKYNLHKWQAVKICPAMIKETLSITVDE